MGSKAKITASALLATGALALASSQLMSLLDRWEDGSRTTVYADKLADDLPTVCAGITRHTSPVPVVLGDYWSPEKCREIEKIVVSKGQIMLAECLPGTISQAQFDALSSMAHNVGNAGVCASRAVGLMWNGQHAQGCRAIAYSPAGTPVWASVKDGVNADGSTRYRFVRGLHNRRIDEMKLCLGQ